MTTAASPQAARLDPWEGFPRGEWCDTIDVRDFIQHAYSPYEGDSDFLSGPTERTRAVWDRLSGLMIEERATTGGVLDVDASTPSTITSHAPGYIDRERELIVGLQTDAPLKRAIMPNGGWRMVENGLKAYGFEADDRVREIFTKYRKTHNAGVFDAYTPEILRARQGGDRHGPARRLRPRSHHRRLPPRRGVRGRRPDRGQAGRARRARRGVRDRVGDPPARGGLRAAARAG